MRFRTTLLIKLTVFGLIGSGLFGAHTTGAENARMTPLVKAVKNCSLSVLIFEVAKPSVLIQAITRSVN